jgi:hypothetical protein
MTTLGFGDIMGVPESPREVGIDKQLEEDRLTVVCAFQLLQFVSCALSSARAAQFRLPECDVAGVYPASEEHIWNQRANRRLSGRCHCPETGCGVDEAPCLSSRCGRGRALSTDFAGVGSSCTALSILALHLFKPHASWKTCHVTVLCSVGSPPPYCVLYLPTSTAGAIPQPRYLRYAGQFGSLSPPCLHAPVAKVYSTNGVRSWAWRTPLADAPWQSFVKPSSTRRNSRRLARCHLL